MIRDRDLSQNVVHSDALTQRDRPDVEPDNEARYVSPEEMADYWGVHVQTVYRDLRKGALASVRLPSGRIRILREDMRRYGRPSE